MTNDHTRGSLNKLEARRGAGGGARINTTKMSKLRAHRENDTTKPGMNFENEYAIINRCFVIVEEGGPANQWPMVEI